jgi:cold shock CspA family protein
MTQGSITKLVSSFGSSWGRIRPQGDSREIFFNAASLAEPEAFSALELGQDVEFDERADQINGAHAEHVVLALPVSRPKHS